MKKFTFMLIALLCAVVTFAAGPKRQFEALPFAPAKASVQLGKQFNAKQAPATVAKKMQKAAKAKARAPKKAVAAADLVGDYQWDYLQSSETSTDLESLETTAGSSHVVISESATTEGGITISGMFTNDLEATIASGEDGDYFVIEGGQLAGTSSYGDYVIYGMFYYEGDETHSAGWYYDDIYGFLQEDGSIIIDDWLVRVLTGGNYDGYSLAPYWVGGSTLTPTDPLALVELPEGVEAKEYVMTYSTGSTPVKVAVDGNDVYFQGMSYYIPEAWVKGTKDGDQVTFAAMQYMGEYGSYGASYFFYSGETVFTYDAEADTYSAEGQVYGVLGDRYYDGNYTDPVISPVVEKAAMPANPEITALTNGDYGWYFTFNVPLVDTEGEALLSSKLSYKIYTDIEGEIAPLTFTPETHIKLTEDMTEIPYGFTEDYDFYTEAIFLNELYSADWNNLGIQSIYYGGGETNATEILWYHIKDYAKPAGPVEATFNFNEMDVATSSNVTSDGDITEDVTFTEEDVVLTISASTASTNNRFWSTNAGPQLRVYGGTLTFEVPEGSNITQIVFNHNGKWGANTVEGVEIPNDADAKVATWTGEAQTVVVAIAANSQINSIVVTVVIEGGEEPVDPNAHVYDFEDGTLQGWTTIDADGDGYTWTLGAAPSINTVNESSYSVYSESYNSDAGGALTPDNYLVSPQIKLDGSISFYACAQDGDWAAEHFAVAVSTAGNTDAADFTNVEEWTMTASRVANPSFAPGKFRGPHKTPGAWYKYTVDLSSYEGAEGYVAIRHFDSTDLFYIVVDDITLVSSHVAMPDFTIDPAEGIVESLSDFTITFNNYDITVAEDAAATLTNTTTETTVTSTIVAEDNTLTISFEETTEPGDYTLAVTGVSVAEGEPVELSFNYTIEAAPEVVVLPEGLEAETWYLSAKASESNVRNQEVAIAIDGSDIYIQGLNIDYLPEAWVKGTIEGNTATFPTGQYFGAYEYSGTSYDLFFLGYDATTEEVGDVVFTIDDEAGTMTTDQMIFINGKQDVIYYYEYYSNIVISREMAETPEMVELPEGVEAEDWTIDGTFTDSSSNNNIVRPTEVAFDGTDIYVKGIPFYFEDSWMKGTIDAETGIATFPTGQFVGEDEYGLEYMVGSDDFETLCDIEFAYDAEAKTLTQLTSYIIENGDTPDEISAYGYWSNMLIYAGEPIYDEPIEAPEDLETDTYLFTANVVVNGEDEETDLARRAEASADTTFDFNAMVVATSSNSSTDGDITEDLVLTEGDVTLTVSPAEEGKTTPNRFWSTANGPQLRVYSGTLTFSVPEGSKMTQMVFNNGKWNAGNAADSGEFDEATWTGEAQTVVVTIAGNTQLNNIVVTVKSESGDEPGEEPVEVEYNYSYQMQVGFDGNDVYFKGVSDDTADMWLKGTLSEDGTTVTIPANQYMGQTTALWLTFDYYFTAVAEDGETMEDIVLNYDAENNKFTTDQVLVLHDGKRKLGEPYQTFSNVVIAKMQEFAATPADPSVEEMKLTGDYPKAYFVIPAEDVDGNAILTSKLFYTVWYEEDSEVKQFTVTAGEYKNVTEDMTEIPYDYDDSYDIYKGGEVFYFNPVEAVASWTKVGIQSIYYGGGERNESNIVWYDTTTTGIADVNVDTKNAVIFDLQGRRVSNPGKGLYIVNGKKVVR